MNPDEINTTIAEWCGLLPTVGEACKPIPDYYHDLNALQSAIATLDRFDRSMWPMHLRRIVVRDADGKGMENPDTGNLDDTHFYCATAPQRCEALVCIIGKSKEQLR